MSKEEKPDGQKLLDAFFESTFPGARVIVLVEREDAFHMYHFGKFRTAGAMGMLEAGRTAARLAFTDDLIRCDKEKQRIAY